MSALFPLYVSNAVSRRQGKTLVGPVDLQLEAQGTTVILGPNGAGKTSLLQLLHGTARLSRGRINWACSIEDARRKQSFVFQRPILLRRSVLENIIYPLLMRSTPRKQARIEGTLWAEKIGLEGMLQRPATMLSGGEQQKLALARALITRPAVLFLDEPCAALDGRSIKAIEDILATARAEGTKLILSTHNMGQARRLADHVIFLLHGKVHEEGAASAFFNQPQTTEAQAFLRGDIIE